MNLLAIDPGPEHSAYIVFDGESVVEYGIPENQLLIDCIGDDLRFRCQCFACEGIACYGMPVGRETFDTCVWIGRYIQQFDPNMSYLVYRSEVKSHLCHSMKAKDPMVRQALLDRFGPGKRKAIGTKKLPGPLHGVSSHCWSALAVAVTWWDLKMPALLGTVQSSPTP